MDSIEKYDEVRRKTHLSDDPVNKYIFDKFISPKLTEAQKKLIEESSNHRQRMMLGSSDELELLSNLCKLIRAEKTIDIGVFTGYSALTIALALPPNGKVIACDINEDYVNIGKPYWKEAGVEGKIDLRIAPALDTLESLAEEAGTFDFIFIDADKHNYPKYYEHSVNLIRSGGIIAVDNTIWSGKIAMEEIQDEETNAVRALNDLAAADDRVNTSFLNMADGVLLIFKK